MNGGRLRRWVRCVATIGVAAMVLLVAAPPAWSHGELNRSDPPNGGMVAPGRTSLRLWFTEPVNLRASRFELRARDGRHLTVRPSVAEDGRVVRLESDPLPVGTYHLDWQSLSLSDGHSSTGSLVFGVGLRPAVVPDGGTGLPPLSVVVLRWVDLASLLVAIGALAVSGRVLGTLGAPGLRPRLRARRIGILAAVVSAYAGLVTPFLRAHATGTPLDTLFGETWATLAGTPWGHLWLAREVSMVFVVAVVWSWARRGGTPVGLARLALAGLAGTAVLESLAGHASSLPRLSAVTALMSAAHVVAAGVWAGGLIVLVLCLVPTMRRNADLRGIFLSSVWRTFSPMAAMASGVLLATGLYEAGRHVPDVASLAGTVYGGALAGKTLLLAVALAMAGLNLLVVSPQVTSGVARVLGRAPIWAPVSRQRFTMIVTVEAVLLVTAIGLAAVLTTAPTAREVDGANQVTAPHTNTVDGLFITFEDIPTGPDRSLLVTRVRSTILPPPAPVDGVDVVLSGPRGASDAVRLARVDEGRFEGETESSTPGAWSVSLRVHRRGLPDTVTQSTWTVTPPSGARVTRLEVIGTALAVVLLLGLVTAVALTRRRPARRTPTVAARQPEPEVSLR
ncbi:MAG: hypothetical protein JWR85_1745 [Marmoricola sp.]|nr:hypothetical protein [Marmoricola sp.]